MSVVPCCDPSVDWLTALFSDSCNWCTSADQTAQTTLMQNPNNQGNTTGIPNCDSNASFLSNIFSNTCNVQVNDAISQAVGLPSIPAYVWWGALGIGAFLVIRK